MRAVSTAAMGLRHAFGAVAQALLIAAIVAALIVAYAAVTNTAPSGASDVLGARGGKTGGGTAGSGTIVERFMDGATEGHYGARVTFDVSTSATPYPYVHLMCYQDGSLVAEGRTGFFPTAIGNEWFYLGPTPNWQGGAADCTAKLEKYGRKAWSVLASTSFHVYE